VAAYLRVALTGGLAVGKSAVAQCLRVRGVPVIDSDELARAVVAPGSPGLKQVVEAFGPGVLAPGGALDRAALAGIVFADPAARRRLEAITHPLIREQSHQQAEAAARAGARAVVFDIPLLVETGQAGDYDLVVVVQAPLAVRLARAEQRGLSREQAEARLASQVSDAARAAVADVVLDGGGSVDDLARQVDELVLPLLEARAA
jgi:dephospho-CoA kinase